MRHILKLAVAGALLTTYLIASDTEASTTKAVETNSSKALKTMKCGAGKCGQMKKDTKEKCGAGKCGKSDKPKPKAAGKCGVGKCS